MCSSDLAAADKAAADAATKLKADAAATAASTKAAADAAAAAAAAKAAIDKAAAAAIAQAAADAAAKAAAAQAKTAADAQAAAAKAAADAQAALNRIKKGEPFDKVAKAISLAPNRVQGGAVGWVQAGQVPPQISAVLVNLGKGQVSQAPIQLQQGWYLIKLEDKRTSKPPSFEQAKAAIRNSIAQRKQFEFISQIAKESKIVIQ